MSNLEVLSEVLDSELNIDDDEINLADDDDIETEDDADYEAETDDDVDVNADAEPKFGTKTDYRLGDLGDEGVLDDKYWEEARHFMDVDGEQADAVDETATADEDDEEEDEDDDEKDDTYLQKFDSEVRNNFIEKYHPEVLSHNYEEVKNLAKITRDKNGLVVDPLHKTLPYLTKYEKARIIGQRAKQIDMGAKPMFQVKQGLIDSYLIALKELELKKIPFIIKRPIPNGGFEYWNLSDLELLE